MKLASPWWVGSTLCSPRELESCVARVQLPEKLVVSGALAARGYLTSICHWSVFSTSSRYCPLHVIYTGVDP